MTVQATDTRNYSNIVSGYAPVTANKDFGLRSVTNPAGASSFHKGVDLSFVNAGVPIHTPYSGTVVKAGVSASEGNFVVIQHTLPDGVVVFTKYMHMQNNMGSLQGQTITAGTEIGQVGSTGISSGPHLHYQEMVGVANSQGQYLYADAIPVDPRYDIFNFSNGGIPPASVQSNISKGLALDGTSLGMAVSDGSQTTWWDKVVNGATTLYHQIVNWIEDDGSTTTVKTTFDSGGNAVAQDTLRTTLGSSVIQAQGVNMKTGSVQNQTLTRDSDAITSSSSYIIQKGDTLAGLAQADGVSLLDYIIANPQITYPELVCAGQVINRPASALTSVTNTFSCTITDPSGIGSTGAADPTTSVNADNSTLLSTGVYTVNGVGNVNTATGNTAYANNQIAGLRPGSYSLVDQILDSQFAQNTCLDPNLSLTDSIIGAAINTIGSGVLNTVPTDPLVLDLNGDGVKLTSFSDAPVLFDINHDGGSKELTGWVSAQDGIVVYDLNGNGKIDDISETMSEYFNGTVGTGGNAGTKPYANGFAALKSLDSNANNQFDSGDAAWNNVKVWVDANHDGITDTGELKTFSSLGITGINLTPTTQSGLVSGGNEILATGTFTMNGATQQAQAARFIANPTGNTTTVSATGSTVAAADGQSTYISAVTTGEAIDVVAKGVKNAYGDTGSDTLTGDANANWLAGNGGSDTFNAGAGDDVLLIDAADQQANIHAGAGFDMVQVVGTQGVTFNLAQAEAEIAIGNTGNDIFIGGGRSSVFVRGGDGGDIIIGGGANDALFEMRRIA